MMLKFGNIYESMNILKQVTRKYLGISYKTKAPGTAFLVAESADLLPQVPVKSSFLFGDFVPKILHGRCHHITESMVLFDTTTLILASFSR